MANIFDVAKYILDSIGEEISTMKLQKLCYYSQAWSLAWTGTHIFDEDFQAWANGPVSEELFYEHQGLFSISSENIEDSLLKHNLTDVQIRNINTVIEFYGDKTGAWLSELTHKERPWKEIREKNNLKTGERCSHVIPKALIQEYYSSL